MAPSLRVKLAAAALALLVVVGFVIALVGPTLFVCAVLLALWALYLNADVLLGRVACWAIGRIPQAYRWTIERISIRPAWSELDAWSEIVVSNWTWHNPLGFDDDDDPMATGHRFLLQIDELKLRLKLSSLRGAFTEHRSLEIAFMRVEGLRFNTTRNSRGSLNMWQALDLPDDDVNVKSLTHQAARYGGLHEEEEEQERGARAAGPEVVPLPPVSTAATRAAADYWRPEWGERPTSASPDARRGHHSTQSANSLGSSAPSKSRSTASVDSRRTAESRRQPLLEKGYVEEPIGDPRRRPRWGVPIRFDIQRLQLVDVQLWVLDLMTMDTHSTAQNMDPDKKRIDVHSLNISRSRLEAGDPRRSGSVDDIHGVYLGELIWVVVAEMIPLILKRSPYALSKTAALAAGFLVKDGVKRLGAKMLQAGHYTGHAMKEAVHHIGHSEERRSQRGCHVQVHLIGGRQVTRKGYAVNAHAFVELLTPTGATISTARSEPQMWTKAPHWDETVDLVGATSSHDVMRVSLYHQKSRQVVGITSSPKETPDRFIGEVVLPLKTLLIRDAVIAEGGEIVGWFPLTDTRGLRQGTPCSGQLKLGLRILGAERLRDKLQVPPMEAGISHHDFAIIR